MNINLMDAIRAWTSTTRAVETTTATSSSGFAPFRAFIATITELFQERQPLQNGSSISSRAVVLASSNSESDEDELIGYVKEGDRAAVWGFILENGKSCVNSHVDKHGITPLIWAVNEGHYDIVSLLIQNGANINYQPIHCYSALITAVKRGNPKIIRLLLKQGADVDQKCEDGRAALMFAAAMDHEKRQEMVQLLLDHKASVDMQSDEEYSALMFAACTGHDDTVKLLLDCGASCNLQDRRGYTSLMLASLFGHVTVAQKLLLHGACIDQKNKQGDSALNIAAQKGFDGIVKLLLDYGASCDIQADNGLTALMLASALGHAAIVQNLLYHGASSDLHDKKGATALELAVIKQQEEVVKLLLNLGSPTKKWGSYVIAVEIGDQKIKRIIDSTLTFEERVVCKEVLKLTALGHALHQKGKMAVGISNENFSCIVEGTLTGALGSAYWLRKMAKCTELLIQIGKSPFTYEDSKALLSLLNTQTFYSPDLVWKRSKSGLPSLLMTGYNGHAVASLIWGPYLILCDRSGNQHPMKVYQFDSNQMGLSFFQEMLRLGSKNKDDYEKFLKQLDGNRAINGIGSMLGEEFPLGYQSVGNCSMACLEAAVWAFIALNKLFGTPQGTFSDKLKANQSNIARAIDYTNEELYDWLFYHQIYHVERYIGTRVLRSQDPKKIERSKEQRKRIEMDYDLYMTSMDTLAGQLELRKRSKTAARSCYKAFETAIVALSNGLSNILKAACD